MIELLITVGLVAIMSAGAISFLGQGPQQAGRDTKRNADLNSVASALALYRNDTGGYPITSNLSGALVPNYIAAIPDDPKGNGRIYGYLPSNSAGTACNGTPGNRCVKFVYCAAGEKITAQDAGCPAAPACGVGFTCSLKAVSQ